MTQQTNPSNFTEALKTAIIESLTKRGLLTAVEKEKILSLK